MVMPYFGSTFGGLIREQVGIKRTGAEMTAEEFLSRAQGQRLSAEDFASMFGGIARRTSPRRAADGPFDDGPPCLQTLARSGVAEHQGRNNTLFQIGVYLRKKWPDRWETKLEEANHLYMQPALPSEEVVGVKRSLAKKDYGYKCADEPMCSVCDKPTCLRRQYGVGGGAEGLPVIAT
jgi:hypothetical protein